jgi:hypothetical protein
VVINEALASSLVGIAPGALLGLAAPDEVLIEAASATALVSVGLLTTCTAL